MLSNVSNLSLVTYIMSSQLLSNNSAISTSKCMIANIHYRKSNI